LLLLYGKDQRMSCAFVLTLGLLTLLSGAGWAQEQDKKDKLHSTLPP
jgi:hypothetical protein